MTTAMADDLTWAEFKDQVSSFLTIDASRKGTEAFRDGLIRQGVIYVQNIIEEFTLNHESLYYAADLVVEGRASRGVKPPQSAIHSMHHIRIRGDDPNKQCIRTPTELYPWDKRFDLVRGVAALNGGRALVAIDPQGYTFYIYPFIRDCEMISMSWNGKKLDFRDDEATPFTEQMALTVAEFVKAKFAREVENDINLHDSYWKSMRMQLPLLRAAARDQRNMRG